MTLTGPCVLFAATVILFFPAPDPPAPSSNPLGSAEPAIATIQLTHQVDDAWRHLRLIRSEPASDTTVAQSPEEIRLYFSETPHLTGSTVRLTAGADRLVETTEAAADEENPNQLFIRPTQSVPGGLYTVHWRVMAHDGHAQRGTFEFRVAD